MPSPSWGKAADVVPWGGCRVAQVWQVSVTAMLPAPRWLAYTPSSERLHLPLGAFKNGKKLRPGPITKSFQHLTSLTDLEITAMFFRPPK